VDVTIQFTSEFTCCVIFPDVYVMLTYAEINSSYFSHLLEKTTDGILKAAKLGDLKMVSVIYNGRMY
jgi:hypothetical protein